MNQEQIKKEIEELLNKLTIEFSDIEIVETPASPLFTVHTNDSGILIGQDGETLRALNTIFNRIISKKIGEENHIKYTIDVNGYHKKIIEELQSKAKVAAERVRLFGGDVELDPMNSYERLLVHSLFSDDETITTDSEGEGPHRRIVIRQKKD